MGSSTTETSKARCSMRWWGDGDKFLFSWIPKKAPSNEGPTNPMP